VAALVGPPTDRVAELGLDLVFDSGEEMLTEISTKFSPQGLEEEFGECGFVRRVGVGLRRRRVPC